MLVALTAATVVAEPIACDDDERKKAIAIWSSVAMPADVAEPARRSLGDALRVAGATADANLAQLAKHAFVDAMSTTSLVGVAGGIAAAAVAVAVLRPKPRPTPPTDADAAHPGESEAVRMV